MEKSVLFVIVAVLATGGPPLLAASIPEGTVVGWGDNNYGQSTPPCKITNAIAIAAGQNHSIAVRQDGTVVAWGSNDCGQTNVPPGLSNVVAVAAGHHSLALRADGSVVEWGNCTCCPIPPNISNVVSIAAGAYHSLALRSNGTVVGWGVTNDGRLTIPPGLSNVTAVAGGRSHSLALKANGSVVGWGSINDGPVVIPSGMNDVAAIVAGYDYSFAMRSNGTVIAWGDDPSDVPAGLSNVVAISGWRNYNLALRATGTVVGWAQPAPTWAFDVTVISAGDRHGLAIQRPAHNPAVFLNDQPIFGGSVTNADSVIVQLRTKFPGGSVFYTLDGLNSTLYSGAFTLSRTATIFATAYSADFLESSEMEPVRIVVIPSYPLSISNSGGGGSWSNLPSSSRFLSNAVVTVTAMQDTGWQFLHWAGDAAGTNATIDIVMDKPKSIQAVFGTPIRTTIAGQGMVLINPESGPYAYGSIVRLMALPAVGYYFALWGGSHGGNVSPTQLPMTITSPTISALFVPLGANQVSFNALIEGRGTVGGLSKNVFTLGDTITVPAVPDEGWSFTGWSGDVTSLQSQITIAMDSSKTVTAHFAPAVPTNITIQPQSIAVSPGGNVTFTVTVTGAAPVGYQWQRNGAVLAGATASTLSLVGVQSGDSGSYSVIVSLNVGTAIGGPSTLLVDEPATLGLNLYPGLSIRGTAGRTYQIEYSDDLVSPTNWIALTNILIPVSPYLWFDASSTNQNKKFYRAVSVP